MIEMKLTKFYTCEDANVAFALSFNCATPEAATAALSKVATMPVPELPPMEGAGPWREMTDKEAGDYMEEMAEQDKMERRRVALLVNEDDGL